MRAPSCVGARAAAVPRLPPRVSLAAEQQPKATDLVRGRSTTSCRSHTPLDPEEACCRSQAPVASLAAAPSSFPPHCMLYLLRASWTYFALCTAQKEGPFHRVSCNATTAIGARSFVVPCRTSFVYPLLKTPSSRFHTFPPSLPLCSLPGCLTGRQSAEPPTNDVSRFSPAGLQAARLACLLSPAAAAAFQPGSARSATRLHDRGPPHSPPEPPAERHDVGAQRVPSWLCCCCCFQWLESALHPNGPGALVRPEQAAARCA